LAERGRAFVFDADAFLAGFGDFFADFLAAGRAAAFFFAFFAGFLRAMTRSSGGLAAP